MLIRMRMEALVTIKTVFFKSVLFLIKMIYTSTAVEFFAVSFLSSQTLVQVNFFPMSAK